MPIEVQSAEGREVIQEAQPEEKERETVVETETSEEPEELVAKAESEGEESETSGKEGEEEEDKPKKTGNKAVEKRIKKLVQQRRDAEQQADYWRREASKQNPLKNEPVKEQPTEEIAGRPNPDNFEDYDEYIEAVTDWKLEAKLKVKELNDKKTQEKTQFEQKMQSHLERVQAFAAKTRDFEEVMDVVRDMPVSIAVQDIILESDNGPELMFELAKDVEEFERINSLSPLAAARAVGRLEASIQEESPEQKQTTTKAPRPLKSVSSKSSGSKKTIFDEGLSQREFERIRQEQLASRP